MSNIDVEKTSSGDGFRVTFRGRIDESVSFEKLYDLNSHYYELELKDVESLNSMGLRNWMLWVKSLPSAISLKLMNCPRVFVDQLNILKGLLPLSAIVESFQVPYFCESCDKETIFLAKRNVDFLEEQADKKFSIEPFLKKNCSECNSPMELDTLPQKYFLFLTK